MFLDAQSVSVCRVSVCIRCRPSFVCTANRHGNLREIFFLEYCSSRELDRVSTGILALTVRIPRKITVGIVWRWLLHTGMAMSSNIFVPSAHTVGESPSQVPGQTCGRHELVKPATRSNTDSRLLHGTK